jgi:hypothetical protein
LVTSDGGDDTTDLVLWLDARTGVDLDENGHVAVWHDQSPYAHDARQSVAAMRPAVDESLGVAIPRFDGVDDHLVVDSGYEDFTPGLSAFIVVRPEATSYLHASRFFDFSRTNGSLADSILFNRFGTGDELLYQTYQGATIGAYVDAPQVVVDDAWQMFEVVASGGSPGSAGVATLYKNGAKIKEGTVAVPTLVTRGSNFIARSNLNGSIDSFLEGRIAELRIYRAALSDDRRVAIENELKARWSL